MMSQDSTAVVLFSGGADSSLAAVLALEKHKKIILLTFKNGCELFIRRSCFMAARLQSKYPCGSLCHKIIDNRRIFHLILRNNSGLRKYLKNPGLLCIADRLAMYAQAAIFCLENQIKFIYDGSNCQQGQIAFPQMPEVLALIKGFFNSYNIIYDTPIYEYKDLAENILLKKCFMEKKELYQAKRLFFKKDSLMFFDILNGLWYKLKNRVHPIFIIETGLQLLGRLTGFRNHPDQAKDGQILEVKNYLKENLEFTVKYIKDNVKNDKNFI